MGTWVKTSSSWRYTDNGFLRLTLPALMGMALALLLALILAAPAFSAGLVTGDGTWQWTNPPVQGNTLKAVSFVDANTGWAVGLGGTVIKTTNGGITWDAKIPSPNACAGVTPWGSGCNLSGVSFIDANNGWAVGDYGTIWHTINGGDSWTSQALPSPLTYANLASINFFNSSVGLAVGSGYSFGTVNGGATWTQISGINTSNYNSNLTSVRMVSASTAFAVGEGGAVYKITGSGSAWTATQQALSGGVPMTSSNLQSVYFIDANNGFAGGGNRILRTTNGGASWSINSTLTSAAVWGLTVSGNNLVVSGPAGTILKRTAATNWTDSMDTVASGLTATSTGTTSWLMAVTFPGGSSTGYAAGTAGMVVRTTDSGATWSPTAGGNDKNINGSSFISDTTGWVVASDHTILKTTDAGTTWTSDNSGIPSGVNLKAVHFLNASTGFAVGNLSGAGVAYKYSSGTWSPITLPAGVAQLWGVHMTDATHGWMVGFPPSSGATTGVALKTVDGSTWTYDATGIGTNIQLYSVDATSSSNGWAVGQNRTTGKGVVAKYAGGVWTLIEKADSSTLISIDVVDGTTGYIAGYGPGTGGNWADGKAYKTTDGGASWNVMSSISTSHLMISVSFINANTGYLAGGEGRVYKTVNGGTNWTIESLGSAMTMNTISAVPSTWSAAPSDSPSVNVAAFVGGAGGSILRSKIYPAGKPTLTLTNTSVYWGSYTDYQARLLSVDYSVGNSGVNPAFVAQITSSTANNGVSCSTSMPVSLGVVAGGGSQAFTLIYTVPDGTATFRATVLASVQDGYGTTYTYP